MQDFELCIPIILANEGGSTYTNKPGDKGGPTRYGIDLATLSAWRKKACAVDDVRTLSEAEAKAIYKANYWDALICAQMPTRAVATALLDAAVLSGTHAAAQIFQGALGVTQDGAIGPKTIAAAAAMAQSVLLANFSCAMQNHYVDIATRDSTQQQWLVGWLKRAAVMQAMPFLLP